MANVGLIVFKARLKEKLEDYRERYKLEPKDIVAALIELLRDYHGEELAKK